MRFLCEEQQMLLFGQKDELRNFETNKEEKYFIDIYDGLKEKLETWKKLKNT